jgi:vacuolar-type H+-ATPase subunit E/Vma4
VALADILQRIEEDAYAEAAEIIRVAEEAAAGVRAEAQERARARLHEVVAHTTAEAEAAARTRLATARLAARDNALAAKRHLVERVLADVVKHLESLSAEEYSAFIVREVKSVARGGEALSIGQEDHGRLGISLTPALKAAGVDVRVRGVTGAIGRGVLIEGDRVKVVVSARSLVESRRDRLIALVSETLFGEEERAPGAASTATVHHHEGEEAT